MFGRPTEQKWKKKYLDALEELEEKEAEWTRAESLLRRSVSRLAIAASGADERVDLSLRTIRKAVANSVDLERLSGGLDVLDEAMRAAEEKKASEGPPADPLRTLLDHLSLTAPGSALIERAGEQIRAEEPEKAAKLLAAAFNEALVPANPEPRSTAHGSGLLPALQELIHEMPLEARAKTLLEERLQADRAPPDEVLRELAQGLSAHLKDTDEAALEPDLGPLLLALLERVSEAGDAAALTASLRAQLRGTVASEDWPALLEELTEVVSGVVVAIRSQREELEALFQHIAEELDHFQGALELSRADLSGARENREDMHASVTAHMSTLSEDARSLSDVEELRRRLGAQLRAIGERLGRYRESETARLETIESRNAELSGRLEDLEFETTLLRQRCRTQQRALIYDGLTQVHSRYAYEHRLGEELERFERYRRPVSYAIWDVDHFKRVNDSYGHKAGDRALRRLAQLVRSHIRESDFLARLGGEEFVILLPGLNAADAKRLVMDKVREEVQNAGFNYHGERVPITISCGVTELRGADSLSSVYERADKALYRAKNEGRNRCVCA